MPKPVPRNSPVVAALKGCGIAAFAMLLQLLIDPLTDNRAPFLFFAAALVLAAASIGRAA